MLDNAIAKLGTAMINLVHPDRFSMPRHLFILGEVVVKSTLSTVIIRKYDEKKLCLALKEVSQANNVANLFLNEYITSKEQYCHCVPK